MRKTAAAGMVIAALLIAGCSSSPARHHLNAATADLAGSAGAVRNIQNGQVLRLGYPDDLDSAPALAAMQLGLYRHDLGTVTFEPLGYQSYLDEINALEHGQLDAAYLDPVAALSAWQFTAPGTVHIMAGATTGTSQLIVRPGVTRPAQLSGTRVEAPADSSQAAALDAWLARNHLAGHVQVDGSPLTTVGILQQFKTGVVSAAWEGPPLAQQLTAAGGHVLATQGGSTYSTGVLVVTQRYLTANPAAVRDLLKAQIQACAQLNTHPGPARTAETQALASQETQAPGSQTGPLLPASVLTPALTAVACSNNPYAASILAQARAAASAAILQPVTKLGSLFDLGPLNALLKIKA